MIDRVMYWIGDKIVYPIGRTFTSWSLWLMLPVKRGRKTHHGDTETRS